MAEPITFYYANCNGLSGVWFRRRAVSYFLLASNGPLRLVEPTDVVMILGELPADMTPIVQHEVATRGHQGGAL